MLHFDKLSLLSFLSSSFAWLRYTSIDWRLSKDESIDATSSKPSAALATNVNIGIVVDLVGTPSSSFQDVSARLSISVTPNYRYWDYK